MPEEHEVVHTRGQQTNAVWKIFSPAFTVGALTQVQHATDIADIITKVTARDLAQDALDDARTARDVNGSVMKEIGVAAPRAIEGQITKKDDFHKEIADCRDIEPNTDANAMARGRRVVSVWTRYNTARAAMAPPLPAFTVRGKTVAQFNTMITGHPALEQTVEDRRSDLSKARSALKASSDLVDEDNKRWFAAWEGEFAVGSPENNALSQIDTGPSTPPPSALEINTVTPAVGGNFAATYVAGGGAHASVLKLQWKVTGVDLDFTHETLVVLDGQTVATGAAAGVTVEFRTKAENSQGVTFSTVKSGVAM